MTVQAFVATFTLLCGVGLSANALPAADTQPSTRYTVIGLGTLGGDLSFAGAIDPAGRIAGSAQVTYRKPHYFWQDRFSHAFLWDQGKITDLGCLPGAQTPTVFVSAMNTHGDVAGAEFDGKGGNIAFCRVAGRSFNLSPRGSIDSHATGINDAGKVVGRSCTARGYSAYIWVDGKGLRIGEGNCEGVEANGINNHDQIVGMAVVSFSPIVDFRGRRGNYRAVVWNSGKRTDLGDLIGSHDDQATYSDAFAINDDGDIAGESYAFSNSGLRHACLWKNGRIIDLGAPPGRSESSARALNCRGQVVGWSFNKGQVTHAFLYENGQMRDLNDLIPPDSGWELLEANGINNRGQICGTGWKRSEQQSAAFVLQPVAGRQLEK